MVQMVDHLNSTNLIIKCLFSCFTAKLIYICHFFRIFSLIQMHRIERLYSCVHPFIGVYLYVVHCTNTSSIFYVIATFIENLCIYWKSFLNTMETSSLCLCLYSQVKIIHAKHFVMYTQRTPNTHSHLCTWNIVELIILYRTVCHINNTNSLNSINKILL